MKKEIKNIIKVEYDNDIGSYGDSLDYGIKYLGDRKNQIKMNTILKTIQYLNENFTDKKLTEEEIFLNYAEDNKEEIHNRLLENVYDDEKDDFKTLQDFINWYGVYELLEELIQGDDDYDILCENNNCKFGTVGYSQWSYFISWHDVDNSFVRDLYEGYNWYSITIIKDNEDCGSISGFYITNTDELDDCIKCNFGIGEDDYLLVDNEDAMYFDKPKIEEVRHINYSYRLK